MNKTIYFRADGDHGKNSGFGHLNRILKIYKFLRKILSKKYKFIFLIKKNLSAIKFLKKNYEDKIVIFSKENLKKLSPKSSDIFIIDTLGVEKKLIEKIDKCKVLKKISFDEIDTTRFNSGIIINGIFFLKKRLLQKKNLKIFQGLDYTVLDEEFSKKKKLCFKNEKNILVTSGGADFKNFLYKIVKLLLNQNYKLNVLIGPGVKKNNIINKISHKNVYKKRNVKNIFRCLQNTNVCICTGGTVMFESISSGKIPIVFENYSHQKYAIEFFSKKKAIINGGKFKNISKKKMLKLIRGHSLLRQKKIFVRNSNLVDGKGIYRVKKIILNYINEK